MTLEFIAKHKWVPTAAKTVAATLSAGAALVSVLTFARAYGVFGTIGPSRLTMSDFGVTWVGISPGSDTLTAIGDTLHLAATVTDKHGTALIGASIRWTSDDPRVATVNGDGTVIAQGTGATTILATVGEVIGRSRVSVRQKVSAVRLAGDSTVSIAEDARVAVAVRPLDAHGHAVPGRAARWRSADSAIAWVDSLGRAAGGNAGRTTFTVTVDGVSEEIPVTVTAIADGLTLVAGGGQEARAGSALPEPVVVRVMSRRGRPLEGAAVRFRASDGDGSAEPASVTSGDGGRVRTAWRLGELPGRQRLFATAEGVDSALVIQAEAAPLAANTRITVSGGAQRAPVGAALPEAVGIRVTDTTGRPLPDIPVSWAVLDGGTLGTAPARTDSSGEARVFWTLGPRAGAQRVRAQVGRGRAVPPVLIAAVATSGAAARLALVSGDVQHGTAGAKLGAAIVVRAFDGAGNPVAAARLTVEPQAGAGTVPESTVVTDSGGAARIRWTLGRGTGTQRIAIHGEGGKPAVSATARAAAGAAANLALAGAPAQARAGRSLTKPVEALVTDVFGNPVPDVVVSSTASAGTVSPARAVTGADGRVKVKWTLGRKAGTQSLAVRVPGTTVKAAVDLKALPPT
jgi:hypothetical protein